MDSSLSLRPHKGQKKTGIFKEVMDLQLGIHQYEMYDIQVIFVIQDGSSV